MIVATKINNSLEICKGLVQFSYGRGAILNALCHFVAQGCHSVVLLCSGTNVAFYKASKVLRNNKNNV